MQIETRRTESGHKPLHRASSLVIRDSDLANPKTVGQRIAARRIQLGMTQKEVAERCHIIQKSDSKTPTNPKPGWTPRRRGDRYPLSRNAYGMYESDSTTPVLDILEQIARALRTSPSYIAFGIGQPDPVERIAYDPIERETTVIGYWDIENDWLSAHCDAEAHELALIGVSDYSASFKPGDLALILRDAEPSPDDTAPAEYLVVIDDEPIVAEVTRRSASGPFRVYGAGPKRASETFDPDQITFLGKIVGRITTSK